MYKRQASDKTAQLESVLNTMSDGVLVLGPQGRIRRCNGAFARLFPQVTDMAGSPVIEVIPSPELQDAVDAMLRSAQVARSSSGNGDEDLDVPRSLRQVQLHLGGRVFSVLISLPVLAEDVYKRQGRRGEEFPAEGGQALHQQEKADGHQQDDVEGGHQPQGAEHGALDEKTAARIGCRKRHGRAP